MVLENVKEMWTETPKLSSGKKGRPVNKDRFISKMWVIPGRRGREHSLLPWNWSNRG